MVAEPAETRGATPTHGEPRAEQQMARPQIPGGSGNVSQETGPHTALEQEDGMSPDGDLDTVVPLSPPAVPMPPASTDLAESGQMPELWNDPKLQLPLAPAPVASYPFSVPGDLQLPGAPLPRDVDGPNRGVAPVSKSSSLLTGVQGLPVVGVAVGGLLGLLWLQMRAQRRRRSRLVL